MQKQPSIWLAAIRNGLIGGAVSLLICLVGMVMQFAERGIISGDPDHGPGPGRSRR